MTPPADQSSSVLERKVRKLALVLALIVAFGIPLGLLWFQYGDLVDALEFKARIKASALSSLVASNPETWMLAENRLQGLIAREPVPLESEHVTVLDPHGEIVTQAGNRPVPPQIIRSYPIYDVGVPVGSIAVSTSLRPLLEALVSTGCISLVLGILIFAAVKSLPLKALRRALTALYQEKERAQTTLYAIGDAVLTTGSGGEVDYLNPAAERMLGVAAPGILGRDVSGAVVLRNAETGEKVENALVRALESQATAAGSDNEELLRADGTWLAVEERASPILDQDGELSGGVLVLRDVSEARAFLNRRTWEATHDPLTGLFNRREFESRVGQALDKAKTMGQHSALCYLDLDRFKLVNDTFGHNAGDQLLKHISQLILSRIRESDSLARLGGDEFGLLLEGCDPDIAQRIALDIVAGVNAQQFLWEGKPCQVGISIGLTQITKEHEGVAEIIGEADCSCYWAKEHGKSQVMLFAPSDRNLAARRSESGWVMRIRDALREDRFLLYQQPFKALSRGKGDDHLEVLIRMVGEDGGIILPGQFLPSAERYKLIPEIDRWVIRQVFSGYREIQAQSQSRTMVCAVNLSGVTLNSQGLFEYVRDMAASHGLPPGSICFEITESVAMTNLQATEEFVRKCKQIGILFALDDFGTGVSSFAYLKHLPVDYLKIDGSFVRNITQDRVDMAMVESINRIGHILGKATVAEFAENEATVQALASIGVDYAQGYGVNRPAPLFAKDAPETPLIRPRDAAAQ